MTRKKLKKFRFLFIGIFIAVISLGGFVLKKSFENHRCANSLSCKESFIVSVNNDEQAIFNGVVIDPPDIDLAQKSTEPHVLGSESPKGEKHIYVDLTTQTLKAYEGDTLFMETKVSSGKWAPTPPGDFRIWTKIRAAKMSGGKGADYYYLPNVPYIMFFLNSEIASSRGFALHGTYWHNNFGHAMSHGCVNLRITDARKLYYWAEPYTSENESKPATKDSPGTLITIYGEAP